MNDLNVIRAAKILDVKENAKIYESLNFEAIANKKIGDDEYYVHGNSIKAK